MKTSKAFVVVAGMALCIAGCAKNTNNGAADQNNVNAEAPTATTQDMNAAVANNAAANADENAAGNGTKGDPGPRG